MRDLQSLCDRLNEIFNLDETPDELSQEAREAIEEIWEERDRYQSALSMLKTLNPHREEMCKFIDSALSPSPSAGEAQK